MKNTTLCYLEKDGAYLMLHRVKKKNDENAGKWVGVGGHFEEGESPYDCAVREIFEETGFACAALSYRGVVTFVSDKYETEQMHLFTSDDFLGDDRFPRYTGGKEKETDCTEGNLAWVEKQRDPHGNCGGIHRGRREAPLLLSQGTEMEISKRHALACLFS